MIRSLARHVIPQAIRRRIRWYEAKLRLIAAYGAARRSPFQSLRYVLFDRELENFTYDLANADELAQVLAVPLGVASGAVRDYIEELGKDRELAGWVEGRLAGRRDRNPRMPFGRRLGWYAVVRVRRPRVVVETGVHDGLGSTALLRALQRNAAEGYEGVLLSFDIRDDVGWLIPDPLRGLNERHIGDALELLPATLAGRGVDVFIHDSDHRYDHETAEFELIRAFARPGAVLMSDNAHAGRAFRDFCSRNGFAFHFVREVPKGHFYPGAGIGLAIVPGVQRA